jgi:hypothetical protein
MSQLERLAEAVVQMGKQSGPAMETVDQSQRSAERLAAAVPNDSDGYSRTIRTHLYEASAALRDVARSLADFDKQAEGFAKRLVGGSGGSVGGIGSSSGVAFGGDDEAALGDYTDEGYHEINSELRSGAASSGVLARAEQVSTALRKLPDYGGDAQRGTTLTPAQIASYVPGQFRAEAAFTSTTRDATRTFDGNALFVISSKSGKDVSGYSRHRHEAEILFDKGSTFYVASNSYDPRIGKHIIVMMEVPHA